MSVRRARILAALTALSLFAVACGGGESSTTTAPPAAGDGGDAGGGSDSSDTPENDTESTDDAADNAAANEDQLEGSDDVRLIEVLDVTTGEATTLADTVDGDRPVLLWFWAPH